MVSCCSVSSVFQEMYTSCWVCVYGQLTHQDPPQNRPMRTSGPSEISCWRSRHSKLLFLLFPFSQVRDDVLSSTSGARLCSMDQEILTTLHNRMGRFGSNRKTLVVQVLRSLIRRPIDWIYELTFRLTWYKYLYTWLLVLSNRCLMGYSSYTPHRPTTCIIARFILQSWHLSQVVASAILYVFHTKITSLVTIHNSLQPRPTWKSLFRKTHVKNVLVAVKDQRSKTVLWKPPQYSGSGIHHGY